jgi:hypothetical protein
MSDKQSQKAGNNSHLVQAQTVIIGIDEKRVREIVEEKLTIALRDFTSEANTVANERSGKFNNSLIKRMVQESALTAFSDPSFQILLIEAQKSAASTEREQDYDLLSELMVHRFQKGSNRIVRAGISRAVEIVDQISDEALLAITVFHSVSYFLPMSGDMTQGLKTLDSLFGKIIYNSLPIDTKWLDHLEFTTFGIPRPDLTIILHAPVEATLNLITQGHQKKGTKPDLHDQDLQHLRAAEQAYLEISELFPNTKLVECMAGDQLLTPQEVHAKIWELVRRIVLKNNSF